MNPISFFGFLELVLGLVGFSRGWLLPPTKFIQDFAAQNSRFSLFFHLPNRDNDNWINLYRKKLIR